MQNHRSKQSASSGHESWAINARAIVLWLVALAILVIVTLVLMELLRSYYVASEVAPNVEAVKLPTTHAFPLLDERQSQELLQTRELAQQLLNEYQWLDRQSGVARIPIDRAMEILASTGLPVEPAATEGQIQP